MAGKFQSARWAAHCARSCHFWYGSVAGFRFSCYGPCHIERVKYSRYRLVPPQDFHSRKLICACQHCKYPLLIFKDGQQLLQQINVTSLIMPRWEKGFSCTIGTPSTGWSTITSEYCRRKRSYYYTDCFGTNLYGCWTTPVKVGFGIFFTRKGWLGHLLWLDNYYKCNLGLKQQI